MSTKKNNSSVDFAGREKQTSIVSRFITEEETGEQEEIINAAEDIEETEAGEAEALPEPEEPGETIEAPETTDAEENIKLKSEIEFLTYQFDMMATQLGNIQSKLNANAAESESAEEPKEAAPAPRYYLKNTLEDAVLEEVTASLKHISNMCKCDKCFYDICAIALNSFPSHYATSVQGELIRKANNLVNIEMRTKITNAVFSAIEIVRKSPMHEDSPGSPARYAPQTKRIGEIVSKPKK